MPQRARFHETFASKTTGLPLASKSVTVYREGATFVSGSGTSPVTLTVRHKGKIAAADTVFINAVTGTTYTVDSVTDTTVVLSGFAGTLSPTALDRIVPSNSLPTLYEDDQGGASTANPLTTSATGLTAAWLASGAYDHVLSGSGVTTTLFQGIVHVRELIDTTLDILGVRTKGEPVYNVMHVDFGATGLGAADDSAELQAAIDAAETAGAGTVELPADKIFLVGTGLTITDPDLRFSGHGRGTVIKADAAIALITVNAGASANIGVIISGIHFDLNSKNATAIDFTNGNSGIARDIHVTNPGATAFGIKTSGGAHETVIEGFDYFASSAAGTAIEIDTNNCKVQNGSIIAATLGISLTPTTAIAPLVIQGMRIKDCTNGIKCATRALNGLFISNMRFEGNTATDIDLKGFNNSTSRVLGVNISNIYSSNGVSWKFENIYGLCRL